MSRRDDAIEAAGLALHCDACTNDGHDGCDTSDWDREAETALDAALAVLQPVVPNTAEALDQLPDGTIIRSHEGTVAERDESYWWALGDEAWWTTRQLTGAAVSAPASWTILWWGDSHEEPA